MLRRHMLLAVVFSFLSPLFGQEPAAPAQPFWRGLPFGAQTLNPDISLIGDFLVQPGPKSAEERTASFREVELGIQAAVDAYARADVFLGFENEEGKIQADVEEAFLTFLSLPFRTQAKVGRFQLDFGRTHRTHGPERDFVDTPLAFRRILGSESAMKANGISANVLLPLPLDSYHELRVEAGESRVSFGPEDGAIRQDERFAYVRQKNFFSLAEGLDLEVGAGAGQWQTEGGVEKNKSTATFQGRAYDLVRAVGGADFALKWKPNAFKSALLEGAFMYNHSRPLETRTDAAGDTVIAHALDYAHDRGGFLHLQVQPLRRWYVGSRVDYVLNGAGSRTERLYSGIVTFFPSEFARLRAQWTRTDSDNAPRENKFFLQLTWSLGPHRAHPF